MAGKIKIDFDSGIVSAAQFRRALREMREACDLAEKLQRQNPSLVFFEALNQARQMRAEKK